jgi:hypothetical protein
MQHQFDLAALVLNAKLHYLCKVCKLFPMDPLGSFAGEANFKYECDDDNFDIEKKGLKVKSTSLF